MHGKKIKILFVLKKRNLGYGPSFGLHCSCDMVSKTLAAHDIDSKIVEVIDGNCIDRHTHQYKPSHVVLEAIFCPPNKVLELVKLYPKIKWLVRLHSASPFLACDGIAIEWLREYQNISNKHRNFKISCNDKRLIEELRLSLNIQSNYTPNIYFPEDYPIKFDKKKDEYLDIACFGAIRELKSHFTQAIAAIIYGNEINKKIRFHINVNRLEGGKTNAILKNIRNLFKDTKHILCEHDWMNHSDLIELLQKQIDIGMAVSYTETFCITGYDYVMNNIPIVCSKELLHVLPIFYADPTDYKSMVNCLRLADLNRFTHIHLANKILLKHANHVATKEWLNLLSPS